MRMHTAHPASARVRRAVNVSLDARLVDEARELGVPLSSTFEEALREGVRVARQARWREENREAIAEYNARVDRDGVFGDSFGNI